MPCAPADPLEALRGAAADAGGRRGGGPLAARRAARPRGHARSGAATARQAARRRSARAREEGALRVARARRRRRGARPLPRRGRWRTSTRWRRRDRAGTPTRTWWPGTRRTTCSGCGQGVADLWSQRARRGASRPSISPGNVGWRARGELVEWWSLDGYREEGAARRTRAPPRRHRPVPATPEPRERLRGGGQALRLRGEGAPGRALRAPGRGDHRVHYEAERAGPVARRLPARSAAARGAARARRGARSAARCGRRARRRASTTWRRSSTCRPIARSIIAVQGALRHLRRRHRGAHPRHARVGDLAALRRARPARGGPPSHPRARRRRGDVHPPPDAAPARRSTSSASDDPAPPYAITPPEVLADPNALAPVPRRRRRAAAAGRARARPRRATPSDPIARMLAAYVAHVEGQDDLGAVLLEPLVKDPDSPTAPTTAAAALDRAGDGPRAGAGGHPAGEGSHLPAGPGARLRRRRRARGPPRRIRSCGGRASGCSRRGRQGGRPRRGAPRSRRSPTTSPRCRTSSAASAPSTGASAGRPEHHRAVQLAAERFPDDVDALHDLLRLRDEDGDVAAADAPRRAHPQARSRGRGRLRARRRAARLPRRHQGAGAARHASARTGGTSRRASPICSPAPARRRSRWPSSRRAVPKKPLDAGGAPLARRRALRPRRPGRARAGAGRRHPRRRRDRARCARPSIWSRG